MKLHDFFSAETAKKAGCMEIKGSGNPFISALEYDSNKVQEGALFFALPGTHTDGYNYIGDAIKKGAGGIIHQRELNPDELLQTGITKQMLKDIVFIRVENSRFAMSSIAAAYHGFPGEKLILIGVTGTEGKSTTVFLIWQLLCLAEKKTGFISTVQYSDGDGEAQWNPEHQTTPEATVVHLRLAQMVKKGCEYAVIETSSHGLSPRTNRLGDLAFDAAVMTTVTHEHLEFHGTWEQYRDDKANLFRSLDKRAVAFMDRTSGKTLQPFGVINAADKSASFFAAATKQKTFMFNACTTDRADLMLKSTKSSSGGNSYEVFNTQNGKTFSVEDKLPGAFNSGNVLAALLVISRLLDRPIEEFVPMVPSLKPVWGRMMPVIRGQPFEVLVDYAHTPSSFQTIFPSLSSRIGQNKGRLISLFGSAGERDTQKRSEQGAIAARYSDIVILADEDPRGEDPMAILEEIAGGCINSFNASINKSPLIDLKEKLFLIPDRKTAIRKAFSLACPGDLVILLGKSHENSIIYKDHIMQYDEVSEAEKALEEMQTN
ncbi:MAG: UDP-N-acetylmuramoyl-L-alanyl-D-glutamate--2,6-diaminopimelate ligase [Treponema sp.]|nr:UDP-N-acetylmuramoyl-L-alanyl-D-glutamate--2,6-diaminopimelate ligase [Treponema sp.]